MSVFFSWLVLCMVYGLTGLVMARGYIQEGSDQTGFSLHVFEVAIAAFPFATLLGVLDLFGLTTGKDIRINLPLFLACWAFVRWLLRRYISLMYPGTSFQSWHSPRVRMLGARRRTLPRGLTWLYSIT